MVLYMKVSSAMVCSMVRVLFGVEMVRYLWVSFVTVCLMAREKQLSLTVPRLKVNLRMALSTETGNIFVNLKNTFFEVIMSKAE